MGKGDQFVLWLIPTLEMFPCGHRFLPGDRIGTAVPDVIEGQMEATHARAPEGACCG